MDSIDIAVNAIDNATRVLQATAESLDLVGKSGDNSSAGVGRVNAELVKLITAEKAAQAFALLSQEEKDAILAASGVSEATEKENQRFTVMGMTLSDLWGAFNMVEQAASMVGQALENTIGPAMKLETEFAKIEGLTDTPAQSINGLKNEIIDLSKEVPVASQELSEAFYFISSSGFQGADAMDVLDASAKAAAAGLGETKVIADAVTSTLNAYQMGGAEAARVTDVLVEAVRQGKGEPAEFAASLGRVLPIAAAAGVTIEEVAASMATMTRTGMKADEAATSLRGTLGALEAPGKQARDALDAIGWSADEVRQSIRERGLLATLQTLMEKTGGNVEILDMIIPNIRALTGVLSTAGSQGEAYAEILGKMQNAAGATDKAFSVMSDTLDSKSTRIKNSLEAIRDKLVNGLLPGLERAATAADTLINGADRINEAFEGTRTEIERGKATYDDYESSLLATAVAAGKLTQAQMDQYVSQGYIIQGGIGQVDITQKMIGQLGLLTEAEWNATHGAYGVSGALDESERANRRATEATDAAKKAAEEKAVADKEAAQAAFEQAEAADKQAKAEEKAAKAYGEATQKFLDSTEAFKQIDVEALVKQQMEGIAEAMKLPGADVDALSRQYRALQESIGLINDPAMAAQDAFGILSEMQRRGYLTADEFKAALGRLQAAAKDGKVSAEELGLSVGKAGVYFDETNKKAGALTGTLEKVPRKIDIDVEIKVHGEDALDRVGGKIGGAIGDGEETSKPKKEPSKTPTTKTPGTNRGGREARAAGGDVFSGWDYWVGEEGPEPFVPAMNGRILSREDAMRALGGQADWGGVLAALQRIESNRLPPIRIEIGRVDSAIDVEALAYRVAQEIQARQ